LSKVYLIFSKGISFTSPIEGLNAELATAFADITEEAVNFLMMKMVAE
jgi:hypothetical protein